MGKKITKPKLRKIVKEEVQKVLKEMHGGSYETVEDVLNDHPDAKVIGPGDSMQRQLKKRYNTDKPAFVIVGHEGNKRHWMVWSATATGEGAPVKRLQ